MGGFAGLPQMADYVFGSSGAIAAFLTGGVVLILAASIALMIVPQVVERLFNAIGQRR